MKESRTHRIELQRLRAMASAGDTVEARVDASIAERTGREDGATASLLVMSEETARALFLLLKTQLAELDRRRERDRP